jgi:methylase of polypeptide subunit release factors
MNITSANVSSNVRQETAASVMYLAERLGNDDCLRPSSKSLKVLDLCTGTGCIPLLFARMFHFAKTGVEHLDILGVDISSNAVELAKQNQQSVRQQYHAQRMEDNPSVDTYRLAALSNTKFLQADILSQPEDPHQAITRIPESSPKQPTDLCTSLYHEGHGKKWDILISNPPYISPSHFQKTTSRSVRNYEPKLALVPPHLTGVLTWSPASGVTQNLTDEQQGDLFYPRLLHLAEEFQTKVLLMEVADLEQAERVAALAVRGGQWSGVEIWCDEPSLSAHPERKSRVRDVPILGQGNGRSVFGWRGG